MLNPKESIYVGLACSFHDPALAIVNASGRVLFAEGTERYLGVKRAFNALPDGFNHIEDLLRNLDTPLSRIVIARTWTGPYGLRELIWLARGQTSSIQTLRWLVPTHNASVRRAGANLIYQLRGRLKSHAEQPLEIQRVDFPHHLTHAATGAFTSEFEDAAVAVLDGAGERSSTEFFLYRAGRLVPIPARTSVNSLGLFYAHLCRWCGWDPFKGEEWKVMGLAASGLVDPKLKRQMYELIDADGLRIVYPTSRQRHQQTLQHLESLTRPPTSSPLEAAVMAATGQSVFQEIVVKLLQELHRRTGARNLVLSGGCALNSSCNGTLLQSTPFQRVHVPMAPADDGNALGAALLALQAESPNWRPARDLRVPYLGSRISPLSLERLRQSGMARHSNKVCEEVAEALSQGQVVAWISGAAEFGPRTLGHRSILADPRRREMRTRINEKIKFREAFRPIAPAILDEHGPNWFEDYFSSPYMAFAFRFRSERKKEVPAVVHEDGTGRVQSVTRELSPLFHELLSAFFARTEVPMLINTSLNIMGKPIVHALEEALGLLLTTDIDLLVIGKLIVEKRSYIPH